MSAGYEVCIHRDGRWEVYSFFDAEQENDAIYQARDISNNYQSVCVLWPSEMRIVYFFSKNTENKKPSYMDVRSDLKLGKKIDKNPVAPLRKNKIKKAPPPAPKVVEEDPHFTQEDQRNAIYRSVTTGIIGLILTGITPVFLMNTADNALKAVVLMICVAMTALATALVYQSHEKTTRQKNQEVDYDHDASWRKLGLSEDVLHKLKQEKTPEMKSALNKALPSIQKEIEQTGIVKPKKKQQTETDQISQKLQQQKQENQQPKQDTKEDIEEVAAHDSPPPKISSPNVPHKAVSVQDAIALAQSESYIEKSERIQAAIKAQPKEFSNIVNGLKSDNSGDFKLPSELEDLSTEDPEVKNALAEASVREMLSEMCREIKDHSYDENIAELKEKHDIAAVLYLAGGTSFMVKDLKLPTNMILEMVPLMLTRLNVNPSTSESIMSQLSHYIHTARHAVMFDRGVTDAKLRSENDACFYGYEEALNKWLELNETSEAHSYFATVLFTDIEGFTEHTKTNGESWMVDVLHAHNDIIRQILTPFGGHEIKHTGDGILVTFSNINKALHAAITIQKGIDIFCKTMPGRAFKMRIGITAGDIVSIDEDVFGSPVNLAARIMNKVEGGEIAISDHIKNIAEEEDFHFEDKGEFNMKGLEPQHIYTLLWKNIESTNNTHVNKPAK